MNQKWDKFAVVLLALYLVLGVTTLWHRLPRTDYFRLWSISNDDQFVKENGLYSSAALRSVVDQVKVATRGKKAGAVPAVRRLLVIYPGGTPFLFSFVRGLSTGHIVIDQTIFRILSLAVFVTGFIVFCRKFSFPWPAVLVTFVVLTEAFWPFRLDAMFVNFNQLQAGLLAVSILFIAADEPWLNVLAGLLTMVLAAFQPRLLLFPALIVLDAVAARQMESLNWFGLGLLGGAVSAILIPATLLGPASSWIDWLRVARLAQRLPSYGRTSLLCDVVGIHHPAFFRIAFVVAVVAAAVRTHQTAGLASASSSGLTRMERLALLSGIAVAVHLTTAGIVFSDNALLLVPCLLVLLRPSPEGIFSITQTRLAVITSILLLAAHPVLKAAGLASQPYQDPLTFFGCLIPLVAAWVMLGRQVRNALTN